MNAFFGILRIENLSLLSQKLTRFLSILFVALIFFQVNQSVMAQQTRLSVQTGHSGPVNQLKFSPDNSTIATAGADNNVILWDLRSGKQITILSGQSGEILALAFHPDQNIIATGSLEGQLNIYRYPSGELVHSKSLNQSIGALEYAPSGEWLAIGTTVLKLMNNQFQVKELDITRKAEVITSLAFKKEDNVIAVGGNRRNTQVINIQNENLEDQLKTHAHDLVFSMDGTYLYGGAPNGKYFRKALKGGKDFQVKANRLWKNYYAVALSGNFLVAGNKDGLISVFDLLKKKIQFNLKAHKGSVKSVAISDDGQLLASTGSDKSLFIWDLTAGKITQEISGTGNRINDVKFSDDGQNVYLAYADGAFRKCQLTPDGEVIANRLADKRWELFFGWPVSRSIDSIQSISGHTVKMWASRKVESFNGNEYKKITPVQITWNTRENTHIVDDKSLKGIVAPAGSVALSSKPDFNPFARSSGKIAWINENNELVLEDEIRQSRLFAINTGHTDMITSIAFNPAYEVLATSSWDGTIKLWGFDGELLITYSSFGDNEFIFIDPSNHYFASKGALDKIGFLYQDKILSFEQFDLIYNRPDLVFGQLPHIQKDYVANYRHAYFKRLEKLGISVDDLKITEDIPTLSFESDQSVATRSQNLNLKIRASDPNGYLDRFFVEVNGVPFFGKEGMKIESQPKFWNQAITIPLSAGLNEIQCYVMNKSGISSLKETFKITYSTNEQKPDLYLVTIGASKYNQSDFNLTYAAKDAQDIAATFKEANIFDQIKLKTVINQDFTKSALAEIKAFLQPAGVDDVVMVSVAGHGVLDQNLDYYLATYDMDFSNPSEKGIAYEALEEVLSVTASRKKTLLMDACHSGELDKSEYELAYEENTEFGDISFRAVGATVVQKESSMSLKSSFELSKMLFADMRSSNGSVVISSAGGAEYAMEGGEWNNGVFTYCLLSGLKTGKADLNNDKQIMLSELQEYIFTEVYTITGGKQQPTSRVENLKNDFRIW